MSGSVPRVVTVDGEPWLSSAVFLSRDDALVVGADAARMGVADPSRLASRPKARLAEREILLGDTVVPVSTMVLALVARAVRAAAAVAGAPVDHLVLTHPADWSGQRLSGLLAAVAGVAPKISTIAEPVGAGVWFATRGEVGVDGADRLPLGAVLGVLDVGGGTVDVAVVRRTPTGIVVVGHATIPDLGGDDLDQRLVDHLHATVPGLADVPVRPGLVQLREQVAFRLDVRRAKELLSRHERVRLRLPGGLPDTELTRADLDRVLYRDLDRITAFTLRAVLHAGVEAHELTALQLAGGSTRIPLLRRLLAEVVPVPVQLDDQPESVVALGACAVAVSHSDPSLVVPSPPRPPVAAQRPPRLAGLVLVVLLAVAGIGYSLLRPADEVGGGAQATTERFTLPAPVRGAPLVTEGAVTDGLVTGQIAVPVRMFDGVTDVDWTVHRLLDPATDDMVAVGAVAPSTGVRWVLVDASIRARAVAAAPYYLDDTYLLDDRGLLIAPERGVTMPPSCPTETPGTLASGTDARQCLAFAVSARTAVRAVVISKVAVAGQVGVTVPVRGAEPSARLGEAPTLSPGSVRPLRVGGVRVRAAVVDVVTSSGAYADPSVVDRPGSRAVVVRAVVDAPREVPVAALATRIVLRDDRSQPVPVRFVSDREGCAVGTAKGRFTVCAVFVVPARMPLGSAAWSGDDARPFFWQLR
ncbi:Hsp70 family protein [Actinophytocola algeriensis]|uniref:Hsp70 protein n=1 Tax=Actinophytocola algeriensis TaxID=1768010 RepID=A0A7W7Q0J4_9PSEU|nr:Hsp70 family protein [Actinophytocola algeriensis]MBB4904762.1 hypothetical protein [Actinophytocola algeriensis]MBE1476379.1 hypothetical protein [Actinophytocola algeriensis]